ncbi:Ppx/GppA phosphatase family protein [Solimicrobium silvestre]|uniref:Exopolyphosphatase n=1 Tax=Solimicrobium silvestre TaxID=2099400 RepID=A0A2S9H5K0_9BURK|nr:Ppx/GppA phosphatase family protein [Solimicrobium silvestre]PRC95269.1 Exopolyphosphatase [Solimicrobium silvestre]
MYAAVDLGSNSFRLHVGRFDGDAMRIVKSAREPIRLGAGLDADGNLTPAAIQSAIVALSRFRTILGQYALDSVRVVATNTMRIAKNAGQFLPELEKAIGYPIEIISGEEEGRLIYMGVAKVLANPAENRLVIDIGGGSTEVIFGHGQEILKVASFSVGTVKQSLSFFPEGRMSRESFEASILSARSHFEDAAPFYQTCNWTRVYGSSGSVRSIAEVMARNKIGDGSLSLTNLEILKDLCIQVGQINQLELAGIKPERTAMVVGGLAILIGVMQELNVVQVQTIEAGLRMGVIWDLHLRATQHDRREQAVLNVSAAFQVEPQRAKFVVELAHIMYEQLKPSADTYKAQLLWAARLHEVGLIVSQTGYHKHGAYLVEYADMQGFTTREQRNMSKMILSQKGNLRKVQESLLDADFAKAVLALRLAVLFMHTRLELSLADVRVRMKSKIELEIKGEWLTQHPTLSYWLEKEHEAWSEINIDFVVRVTP